MACLSPGSEPLAAPSAHSIRAAVKMASAGLYGVSFWNRSIRTAYSANVAGSNCIGPSAPLRFLPWCTPRALDRPLFDSIVPMPASTSQASPRQLRAAATYQVSKSAGIKASSLPARHGLTAAGRHGLTASAALPTAATPAAPAAPAASAGSSVAPARVTAVTAPAAVRATARRSKRRIQFTHHICAASTLRNHLTTLSNISLTPGHRQTAGRRLLGRPRYTPPFGVQPHFRTHCQPGRLAPRRHNDEHGTDA